MSEKPVAAGKSSLQHVDQDLVFANIITEPDAVYLDLASGAGRYTLALAERLDGRGVIHAFDLWEEGIATLRETATDLGFDGIEAEVVDITGPLPLADGSVDVCFIATALHDLPEDKRDGLIGEIQRVLAPHGTFILIEFKKIDHGPGPGIAKRIGEADADSLVLPHGFEKRAVVDLGEFPYLVKYSKV